MHAPPYCPGPILHPGVPWQERPHTGERAIAGWRWGIASHRSPRVSSNTPVAARKGHGKYCVPFVRTMHCLRQIVRLLRVKSSQRHSKSGEFRSDAVSGLVTCLLACVTGSTPGAPALCGHFPADVPNWRQVRFPEMHLLCRRKVDHPAEGKTSHPQRIVDHLREHRPRRRRAGIAVRFAESGT